MQRPGTMFDLTSSKLLILAVVALLVVGPKDLPALLRTVGRYMGMIKRQADEFRRQFEDAMRETELADLKKEVEDLGKEAQSTLNEATQSVESHVGDVTRELNDSLAEIDKPAVSEAQPQALPHTPAEEAAAAAPELTSHSEGDGTALAGEHGGAVQAPPAAHPRDIPVTADAGHGRSGG